MKIAILGIDLGKNSCSVVGLDHAGTVVKRRRMRPESIPAFTRTMPTCTVAMEACCGAHHFGRLLRSQGHTVRPISPEYVRPYGKVQKNDDMRAEWLELDQRIATFDNEFAARARSDADARRLATIPGIGVLNATALVAAIGNGETFARGRDLAAWLGLVPRQVTTGGKPRLFGITKRGNKYLRKLIIHGARSALPVLASGPTPLGEWLRALMKRVHKNVAVVALANKLARITWAVLRRGEGVGGTARAATGRGSGETRGQGAARPV